MFGLAASVEVAAAVANTTAIRGARLWNRLDDQEQLLDLPCSPAREGVPAFTRTVSLPEPPQK